VLTLLGWTRRDVIGAPLSRLVPPPLSTSLMHYMQTALTEGVHVRGLLHTTRPARPVGHVNCTHRLSWGVGYRVCFYSSQRWATMCHT
jgi:hypothetical protein